MRSDDDISGLVIIGIGSPRTVRSALQCQFRVDDENNIELSNRYFTVTVPVAVHDKEEIDGQALADALSSSAAQAVVITENDKQAIESGKDAWEKVCGYCNDSAISIMCIEDVSMSDEETSKLVHWGVEHGIEIITENICAEEGISVAHRIKQALECAQWKHSLQGAEHDVLSTSTALNTKVALPCGEVDDTVRLEVPVDPKADISQPTALRRRLNAEDVSRIEQDLVLISDFDDCTA